MSLQASYHKENIKHTKRAAPLNPLTQLSLIYINSLPSHPCKDRLIGATRLTAFSYIGGIVYFLSFLPLSCFLNSHRWHRELPFRCTLKSLWLTDAGRLGKSCIFPLYLKSFIRFRESVGNYCASTWKHIPKPPLQHIYIMLPFLYVLTHPQNYKFILNKNH